MAALEPDVVRKEGTEPVKVRETDQLDTMRRDMAAAVRERDAALRQSLQNAAAKAVAEGEVKRLGAELAEAVSQRDAALDCIQKLMLEGADLATELKDRETEVASFAAERDRLVTRVEELSEELKGLNAEVELLRLRPAEQAKPVPGAAVPGELPLAMGGSAAAQEFAASFELEGEFGAGFIDNADFGDFFGSAEEFEQPVMFLLQKGAAALEYGAPEEVIELHQSVNFSHVSPEGKGQETCKGYVCCLKKGDKVTVHAVLRGVESGRIWVYAPERQPADEHAGARTIRDALRFAEDVGLLMEPVLREDTLPHLAEIVKRCPVLRAA